MNSFLSLSRLLPQTFRRLRSAIPAAFITCDCLCLPEVRRICTGKLALWGRLGSFRSRTGSFDNGFSAPLKCTFFSVDRSSGFLSLAPPTNTCNSPMLVFMTFSNCATWRPRPRDKTHSFSHNLSQETHRVRSANGRSIASRPFVRCRLGTRPRLFTLICESATLVCPQPPRVAVSLERTAHLDRSLKGRSGSQKLFR